MALLDVRQGTSGIEVFVADPWHGNQPEGWRSLDVMLVSLSSYILIES